MKYKYYIGLSIIAVFYILIFPSTIRIFLNGLNESTIQIKIISICLYILGQYIIFNKLFSRYNFYSLHQKLVNCMVTFILITLFNLKNIIGLYFIFFYIPIIIILMFWTYIIIDICNYFIAKISNITKKEFLLKLWFSF